MKTSALLSILALLATSSALPADVQARGFPFSFPGFGGGFARPTYQPVPTTRSAAVTTKAPTAMPTSAYPSPTRPTTMKTASTTTTSKKPAGTSPSTGNPGSSGGGSTENGVVNGECKDLTVIFARGTSEQGNVGTVSGPPMFKALRSSLGTDRVTVQGVDYPATWEGNSNQGGDGGAKMASLVKQALSQCPNTKIALSGYSQGGMVVHNAVAKQGVSASSVAAVVQFGDPMNGQSVGSVPASKVLQFCASGDSVCDGSGSYAITQPHMSYGSNAQEAADFIIRTAGL